MIDLAAGRLQFDQELACDVGNDKVFLKGKIASAGTTVVEPSLQMRLGENGRVRISGPGDSGTFDLEILITKADGPVKPGK